MITPIAQTDQPQPHAVSFTPGPWKSGPVFGNEERAVFWTDESKPGRWQRRLDEKGIFSEANARLIASAPQLLEALQYAEAEQNKQGWLSLECWSKLRAAIASAIGGGVRPF